MKTELATLDANATELGQIRRSLRPQRRSYNPQRRDPQTSPWQVVEVDEYELDLVEIFARLEVRMN